MHGSCEKPLECKCQPGFRGLLCQSGEYLSLRCKLLFPEIIVIPFLPAMCNSTCHREHGYCEKPGECRCKTGWVGDDCDTCHPYPGCKNGTCRRPWECNCKPGWGGFLCDEQLDYCEKNTKTCLNGGKCTSLTKDDGEFKCECPTGYRGKKCEKAPAMAMKVSTTTTSTTAEPPVNNPEELEVEEEMALQEPENAPKLRAGLIPEDSTDEEKVEDIDNEAL